MKRLLAAALVSALLSASHVRADVIMPPPPPPPPPPGELTAHVVAGCASAAAIVLAGVWLVRSRRAALRG
ncbi:hypothetical protein R5W24_003386 [Gemmata sp. JC717]|uniref:hypothetical protein n=1 Tax=Gemmata algarum TaxID=2975278 RepID=UPI0021BB6678|nr:hypothetical protein [Gemmata algarum]MDY3554267.1 hypothetical protein [Gemmata algarum]